MSRYCERVEAVEAVEACQKEHVGGEGERRGSGIKKERREGGSVRLSRRIYCQICCCLLITGVREGRGKVVMLGMLSKANMQGRFC